MRELNVNQTKLQRINCSAVQTKACSISNGRIRATRLFSNWFYFHICGQYNVAALHFSFYNYTINELHTFKLKRKKTNQGK